MSNIAAKNPPLLSVKNLTLAYGSRVIQENINFDVKRGSIFALMGGSGCGKSTLLKSMIGLLQPKKGDYQVNIGLHPKTAVLISHINLVFYSKVPLYGVP